MKVFNLTDPGEGLTEAEIITWRVAEGDTVKVNDIVVEVETSKSLVELPIPWAGTVAKLLVAEGETVDVGTPIIQIDDGSDDEPQQPAGSTGSTTGSTGDSGAAEAKGDSKRTPNLVGYGPTEQSTKRRPRKAAADQDPAVAAAHEQVSGSLGVEQPVSRPADVRAPLPSHSRPASQEPGGSLPAPGDPGRSAAQGSEGQGSSGRAASDQDAEQQSGERPRAKPPVRRLAKDLGVDLHQISGSGPEGIITREDVQQAAEGGGSAEVDATGVAAGVAGGAAVGGTAAGLVGRRVPIKGVRRATAEAMVSSAFTAPHASEWVTLDVTESVELLERLKSRRELREIRISPLLLVARAALLAIRRNPELNTSWDEQAQEIVYHPQVNLGIAAATPRGLVVPNIKGADRMDLVQLATELAELVAVAKQGRTQPAQLSGGTFTITNVGVFGIDAGTPILNPGEAGIVAMGAFNRRPWVVGRGADERIEPRWVTTLAVSFDHRLVDGEQGSKFLADMAAVLSDPGMALLF